MEWSGVKVLLSPFWIVLCQTQCFMASCGDLSVLHLMVSYKCEEGVSGRWCSLYKCVCQCVGEGECLAGSRGVWGSAMPPTVVYLGLVHAPMAGSILGAPCPSTAPLVGVLTLQQCFDTLVFHPTMPSAPFLPSVQPRGFPDETKVRGNLLSCCERQSTAVYAALLRKCSIFKKKKKR